MPESRGAPSSIEDDSLVLENNDKLVQNLGPNTNVDRADMKVRAVNMPPYNPSGLGNKANTE